MDVTTMSAVDVTTMDPFEEAVLTRNLHIYDIVLVVITYLDIVTQCYVIVVMVLATPEKMRQYRFFMMLYTLCDLSFAIMLGIAIHPTPILSIPCAALRGVFQAFDRHVARLAWSLALFCGTAVLAAQDYCIIYRGAVVWREGRYLSKLVTRTSKLVAVTVIFFVASLNAFVGYFLASPDKYTPEEHPQIRIATNPGSDAYVCVSLAKSPIFPLPVIVLPGAGIAEVVFYGLALATVIYIRKHSSVLQMSERSRKLNIQLSLLLLMQTTTPILSIFIPFLIIIVPTHFGFITPPWMQMTGYTIFSLFPLINAILTIVFVKPYREFTIRRLTQSLTKIGVTGRGSVVWVDNQPSRSGNAPSVSTQSARRTRHSVI
ncbi:SRN-1 protein [Aphelenchoides avenae]|nr:SRN-1 protein [Aphelenchus avenae]